MLSQSLPRQWVRHSPLLCASILAIPVKAELLEDSSARLELRNYYFNRDYREGTAPTREEWAQGFLLRLDSGFTEGTSASVPTPSACSGSSWIPLLAGPAPGC